MVGRCTEGREEVEKLSLLSLADALEIKNFAEVSVGFVGNMDKVGCTRASGGEGRTCNVLRRGSILDMD